VRWPGKVPAGKVSNDLVHQVDWFTTLLLAAGARVPADRLVDGMDLREFLLGEAEESGRDTVLCLQATGCSRSSGGSGSCTCSSRTRCSRPGARTTRRAFTT
jgi:arylsulfatase A-like enzyme